MSPKAQQIAIAKDCGVNVTAFRYSLRRGDWFTFVGRYDTFKQADYYRQIDYKKSKDDGDGITVGEVEEYTEAKLAPDYLNDRNAMAGALSTRKGNEAFWETYWDCLCDITKAEKANDWGRDWTDPELLLNPTAAQQAEAFLRALNLFTL